MAAKNETQAFKGFTESLGSLNEEKSGQTQYEFDWSAILKEKVNSETDPPVFAIVEVTKAGLITFAFSKTMIVPDWELLVVGDYSTDLERMQALEIEQFLKLLVDSD